MPNRFESRSQAGRALGEKLRHLRAADPVVLALPRGGIAVAREIASALGAPLDVLNVRKVGVPGHEELAMGAVATGGVRVWNDEVLGSVAVSREAMEALSAEAAREVERRERLYRVGRPPLDLRGRTVILVDDGIATGATMRAAVDVARASGARRVVAATPVVDAGVAAALRPRVDELVALTVPSTMIAVGVWYDDFPQLSDDDVRHILSMGRSRGEPRHGESAEIGFD